jgi:outer membrane biosynthesis protein TonB
METLETDVEEPLMDARPVGLRRRPGGGMSSESLLASFLLHLAVLFLVIVFAPDRPGREHDAVLIDISKFVLPEASSAAPPAPDKPVPPTAEAPQPAPPQGAADAPVEIPEDEVAAAQEEEPPKPPEKEAPPQEPAAAPAPEAPTTQAAKTEATPPVPESSLPHEHGAYDPFEVYKAALAERVNRAMSGVLNESPILRVFRGRLVVHLYLDQEGRPVWFTDQAGLQIRGAAICLHHKEYQIEPIIPMNEPTFMWYSGALDGEVVKAINDGAPYPAAPPGLTIPHELSYVFDLPDRGFHHPPLPQAPAAGPPQG